MRRVLAIFLTLLLALPVLRADEILLTNGNVIHGKIINMTAQEVEIEIAFEGRGTDPELNKVVIAIPRNQIQSIRREAGLFQSRQPTTVENLAKEMGFIEEPTEALPALQEAQPGTESANGGETPTAPETNRSGLGLTFLSQKAGTDEGRVLTYRDTDEKEIVVETRPDVSGAQNPVLIRYADGKVLWQDDVHDPLATLTTRHDRIRTAAQMAERALSDANRGLARIDARRNAVEREIARITAEAARAQNTTAAEADLSENAAAQQLFDRASALRREREAVMEQRKRAIVALDLAYIRAGIHAALVAKGIEPPEIPRPEPLEPPEEE